MKSRFVFLLAVLLLAAGCGDKKPRFPPTPKPEPKPVVTVPPVPSKPYEEGYDIGFRLGKEQAAPKATVPPPEDIERLAREEAGGRPDRTERWERGFAAGYADGFRNVVTGQK